MSCVIQPGTRSAYAADPAERQPDAGELGSLSEHFVDQARIAGASFATHQGTQPKTQYLLSV